MIFKKLFKRSVEEIKPPNKKKVTLADIKQFDDIFVKIDNTIFEGWVVSKKENVVSIVYSDKDNKLQDISFKIERPLDRTKIEQNSKTLILNKDEI